MHTRIRTLVHTRMRTHIAIHTRTTRHTFTPMSDSTEAGDIGAGTGVTAAIHIAVIHTRARTRMVMDIAADITAARVTRMAAAAMLGAELGIRLVDMREPADFEAIRADVDFRAALADFRAGRADLLEAGAGSQAAGTAGATDSSGTSHSHSAYSFSVTVR